MFVYSDCIEKQVECDLDSYIDSFKTKVLYELKVVKSKVEIRGDIIYFKRIIKNITQSGQSRTETLKLMNEGSINIEKIDLHKIRISWSVKLDTLLFFSISVGLIVGLLVGFANQSMSFFILITLFSPPFPYFVGYYCIVKQINDLILKSL